MRLSLSAAAAALGEAVELAAGANDRVRAIHLGGDFVRALPGTMTSLTVLSQLGDIGMGSDSLLRLVANRSLPRDDRARIADAGIALERRLDRPHALADWHVAEVELPASDPATHGPMAERARAEAADLDRPDLELRLLLTGTVGSTVEELDQLRAHLDTAGEQFLCDVVLHRTSRDPAARAALLDRGRVLYRRTPFLSYREALVELGENTAEFHHRLDGQ